MESFVGIVFARGKNRYFHLTSMGQVAEFMERRKEDGCEIGEVAILRDDDEFRAFIAKEMGECGVLQTPANN